MSLSHWLLALFLSLLSLQLGVSMELPLVAWIGGSLGLLGGFQFMKVERPSWGLVFVLLATGGFLGSQVLEDWAVEGSWAQTNGLGAGLVLSLLVYLLWLFAARASSNASTVMERDCQTILVLGLLLTLLLSPPQSTVVYLFGVPIAVITVAEILLASLVLIADRCVEALLPRLMLLLPLFLVVPLVVLLLGLGQGPVIAAIANLFPTSSNFTPTGFSPYQQLRASVYLRPSTRAVMRIESEEQPAQYLAGNRLSILDEEMVWLPSEQPLSSYSGFEALSLSTGEFRFEIDNHHADQATMPPRSLTVHSLTNDNYLFVNPGTSHVTGRFAAISRNAADVLTPAYERGTDKRWQLSSGGSALPDTINEDNLQLPAFWDAVLQQKSDEFRGANQQQTVNNVLNHFIGRSYSLRTNFDPDQPFHDFYLNDREGYCFWFATAATLALRANDIPSRLVGGYVIHERLNSNLWLVRGRDAHSWVEWQDASGYWHTIDPTPPSITAFFGGYDSNPMSAWYHILAGQWQILIDNILEDELTANLVRYGGLLVLGFLFVREYRRLRGQQAKLGSRLQQWQKLWNRFLAIAKLPANPAWTAATYANNLPADWPGAWQTAVQEFLHSYNAQRFSENHEQAIQEIEQSLEKCSQVISKGNTA